MLGYILLHTLSYIHYLHGRLHKARLRTRGVFRWLFISKGFAIELTTPQMAYHFIRNICDSYYKSAYLILIFILM